MSLLVPREPFNAWSHGLGLVLAVPATLALLWRSKGQPAKQVCFLIYGLTLIACYAASTFSHGVHGPPELVERLKRLDLAGIYLLIAGTYTPPAWFLLRGRWRSILLGSVWLVAGSAALLVAVGVEFPRVVSTGLYLALGWACVACYFEIARAVPRRALNLLILGGVFYSVGALLNLLNWPTLVPGAFGPHEVFHLFVLAGSAAHYRFMTEVILPFTVPASPRRRPRKAPRPTRPAERDASA